MDQSSQSGSFAFTYNDIPDLFYALHNVNIELTIIDSPLPSLPDLISVNITDVFDFAYDNDYDSLFTSLVNNWAWLCQQINVLNEISVSILFNEFK